MVNQRLWGRPFATPEEAVGWLGALQAQEFPYAKWSVAQRSKGVDAAAMAKAFDRGTILRSHFLRPTWHFARAEDIRWLLALTAPRVNAASAYQYRQHGLDEAVFAAANAALARMLAGGAHATRREIAEALRRTGIEATGVPLGLLLMRAELDAVIVSGPMRGKQHTYALLEERAPKASALERDEALAELARRYFRSRGPATLKDLSVWASLTMAECRRGVELLGPELERVEMAGRPAWQAPGTRRPRGSPRPRVDLVQGFDEIIMSYLETRGVVAAVPIPELLGGRLYGNAILLEGRLVGRWRHDPPKDEVRIETILRRPLEGAEAEALDGAVARYGRYLGVPALLS